ncbi:hypothetical protein MMC24_002460 [Lignoscripta atroalba]|nr:hypothetical protein [Lignoscripta atroalba]
MPQEDDTSHDEEPAARRVQASRAKPRWFTTPKSIKRLFDKFPLQTLPANELPQRTAQRRDQYALYVFTTADGAKQGEPSFNPSCLKWQAYLSFIGIPFTTVPSNNHASPTGALPFLLPPSPSPSTPATSGPIPSNKLHKWAREKTSSREEPSSLRYEAYTSLLDHRIRNAWLYTLYLEPPNFASVAQTLYITPSSSNTLVRATIAHQLRAAAELELLKQTPLIDVQSLYDEAENAFSALSTLLADDDYFFGATHPGLFDASVFAYTHLLLDEELGWQEMRLVWSLQNFRNLVQHRRRLYKGYFGRKSV